MGRSSRKRRFGGAGIRRGTRVPGGVAAWTPTDLADLHSWHRADDVITSGSSITTWTNKAQDHAHLTQASSSAQPTLTTRAGQAVASFDGGDSVAATFGHTHAQPNTVFAVFEASSFGATRGGIFDGVDSSNRHFGYFDGSGTAFGAYAGTIQTGGSPSTGTIYAGCWAFDGASSEVYVNNFTSAVISANVGAQGMAGLTVGANQAGAEELTGYIWEVVVVLGRAVSAAERAQFGEYATGRYDGLTVTT